MKKTTAGSAKAPKATKATEPAATASAKAPRASAAATEAKVNPKPAAKAEKPGAPAVAKPAPAAAARPAAPAAKAEKSSEKMTVQSLAKRLDKRMEFEVFIAKLGAKDRLNLEKHVTATEAEPDPRHAKLWKRLVGALATLAPHAAQTSGQQSIQFYIADGKYRKQVFALEDLRDGKISIYTADALEKATKAGVIEGPVDTIPAADEEEPAPPTAYHIGQRLTLSIESLDSNNTPDPPAFYKHMLGWNRKALRIILPYDSAPPQIAAAEGLCAMAAEEWRVEEPAV